MENSILNSFPVDPGIFLIVLLILNMILIIVTIRCTFYYKRLYRGYDVFMRGKDAETLEDTIMNLVEYTEEIGAQNESISRRLKEAFSDVSASYQKTGIVKYNALKGMGGNLSFCLTLLDDNNTGFILNCVHSGDGCYLYLKDVIEGTTQGKLGVEEQQSLEQALGYVTRPGHSRMRITKMDDTENM